MSLPRPVFPGSTYLVTRRCTQRQFWLIPTELVRTVYLYVLAYAAWIHGVEVHAFCVLSNHFHLVLTDVHGALPKFMHLLDMLVGKALNVHYKRGETLWSSVQYSRVRLVDSQAVLDKIVYTLANPVEAGLVSRAERWPGLITLPAGLAKHTLVQQRPDVFFSENGPCPKEVSLTLTKPEVLDMTDAEYRAVVGDRLAAVEERARGQRHREGKQFLGRRRVLQQNPWESPGSSAPDRGLNPRIACRDKWARLEALQQLSAFWVHYREAWERLRRGERDVVFPAGTYELRELLGVACVPP